MSECWACTNPARSNKWRFSDATAVGCCTRCSCFVCNGHAEWDRGRGVLVCAPCVGGADSTPRPGPGPGDQPSDPPSPNPRGGPGAALVFSSIADALRRFPRFHQESRAHAQAIRARLVLDARAQDLVAKWAATRGESIPPGAVDVDLIAAGFGLTLWSAGLDVDEMPERHAEPPDWLATNPLLVWTLGQRETA